MRTCLPHKYIQCAYFFVANIMKLPHFRYNLSSPRAAHFGFIFLGDEKILHLDNHESFYKHLGVLHTAECTGFTCEELVWYYYRRIGSKHTLACLQGKILDYVLKHSDAFRKRFEQEYSAGSGCSLDNAQQNGNTCGNCAIHPARLQQEGSIA